MTLPRKHLRPRSDTAHNWQTLNPVLKRGELGWAFDTRELKIGDGASTWNQLEKVAKRRPE